MKLFAVNQGEFKISNQPDLALTTVLGSCVAVCVRNVCTGVGGMNHFLLPREVTGRQSKGIDSLIYGMYSIERLINAVIHSGGNKTDLEVKVFGGARMLGENLNIGEVNSRFVNEYFEKEGMEIAASDMGGTTARKVRFVPSSGKVLVAKLTRVPTLQLVEREKKAGAALRSSIPYGNLEILSPLDAKEDSSKDLKLALK
jgi:chemotaxis protein CheD